MKPGDAGFGVEPKESHGTLTTADGANISSKTYPTVEPLTYGAFYEIFAKALEGKGEVPVTAEDAANVIRLAELAKKSSDEGRTLDV